MIRHGFLAMVCLVMMGASDFSLMAQPRHIIKTNLMSFLTRNFGGSYEYAVTPALSLAFEGNYVIDKRGEGTSLTTTEKGFNLIPQLRFYPNTGGYDVAPKGLFIGAIGFYEKRNAEIANDSINVKGTVSGFGAGVTVGYQWILSERFACELSYSPAYAKNQVEGPIQSASFNGSATPIYEPPKDWRFGRFGIYIGIAF